VTPCPSVTGTPKMSTPNLDKLIGESLFLKSAQVQQAVCSPTRTSILTSRYCPPCPVAVAVARTFRRRLSRSRPRCRTSTHWCRSDTVVATACAKRGECSHVSVNVPNRPDAVLHRPSVGTRTRRGCGICTRTSGRRLTAWPLPHCLDAPHAFSPQRCCHSSHCSHGSGSHGSGSLVHSSASDGGGCFLFRESAAFNLRVYVNVWRWVNWRWFGNIGAVVTGLAAISQRSLSSSEKTDTVHSVWERYVQGRAPLQLVPILTYFITNVKCAFATVECTDSARGRGCALTEYQMCRLPTGLTRPCVSP
jgi:hypothetical protein